MLHPEEVVLMVCIIMIQEQEKELLNLSYKAEKLL